MKHENILQFRAQQLWELLRLAIAFIVSLMMRRRPLWLVCERGTDARDNGYWFFKYMRDEHAEQEVYYLITRTSEDYKRVVPYLDHVIPYKSMKHYIMLWQATHLISSHIQGYFPFCGLGLWLKKVFPYYQRKKHIGLKHGITKDHMTFMDYSNTGLDMIVAGIKPEAEYFCSNVYGYPAKVVKLTGHCRYDQLNEFSTKRQILYMPTWREWIYRQGDFEQSEFAHRINNLLHNKDLVSLLQDCDFQLIFYPHYEIQKHIDYFAQTPLDSHIILADKTQYDVQQLLKESMVLLTDYSSVYFDFAYMRKPVLFYQFDYARYREEHYAAGWYDYQQGLGPVASTEAELIDILRHMMASGCEMDHSYRALADSYFTYRDNHNCERVYQAIMTL